MKKINSILSAVIHSILRKAAHPESSGQENLQPVINASPACHEDTVFLAISTTGLDPKRDAILKISICDPNLSIIFSSFIRPDNPPSWSVWFDSVYKHGIVPAMVQSSPGIVDVMPFLRKAIEKKNLVLFNEEFVRGFLPKTIETIPLKITDLQSIAGEIDAFSPERFPSGKASLRHLVEVLLHEKLTFPRDATENCLILAHVFFQLESYLRSSNASIAQISDAILTREVEMYLRSVDRNKNDAFVSQRKLAQSEFFDHLMGFKKERYNAFFGENRERIDAIHIAFTGMNFKNYSLTVDAIGQEAFDRLKKLKNRPSYGRDSKLFTGGKTKHKNGHLVGFYSSGDTVVFVFEKHDETN